MPFARKQKALCLLKYALSNFDDHVTLRSFVLKLFPISYKPRTQVGNHCRTRESYSRHSVQQAFGRENAKTVPTAMQMWK